MDKQTLKDQDMKKMMYYLKVHPDWSESEGIWNKFKIQESWLSNIEV